MDTIRITGFSTALYSTWFFIEPYKLLLDCGDGACALLGQKSGKVRTIALTHADRDHLTGLGQFNQLNAAGGKLRIVYPESCGSFPALQTFFDRFDPHVAGGARWETIANGERIELDRDLVLEARSNPHKSAGPGETKSVGYRIYRVKRKLKSQYRGVPGKEIAKLVASHGKSHIEELVDEPLFGFSGDTPVESPTIWDGLPVLIHESTFLNSDDAGGYQAVHSNLPAVMEALATIKLGRLILSHFSTRYRADEIRKAVVDCAHKLSFPHPIWLVLPLEVRRDILLTPPVWPGTDAALSPTA
ncbi:MAG: MBL fold metallo-hydrolase [Myxococcota bacterium]